jgi:hypothetical protein
MTCSYKFDQLLVANQGPQGSPYADLEHTSRVSSGGHKEMSSILADQ